MVSSRPLLLSIALLASSAESGLAQQKPNGSAKPVCASIDAKTMRRLNLDPKLSALRLGEMPCESLERLAQIFKQAIPEPGTKRASLIAKPAVADLQSANAKMTPGKPADSGPQHGTAAYAQENAQRFFVRQSALDSFYYLYPALPKDDGTSSASSASKALGASVSYTNDEFAKTQVVTIQGYTSYVVARDLAIFPPEGSTSPYISKWAIAPWLSASGTLNEPPSPKEKSALQFGGDVQFEVSHLGPFSVQDFRLAPYIQTDFRGLARIDGFDALWEPYLLSVLLGGADHAILNDFMFFYWRLIAEADIKHVDIAGETNFLSHHDYDWLGATLQAKISLFPNSPNQNLAGRIYLSESFAFFENAASPQRIEQFISEIGYNLSTDGSSSISLQYTNGTDKATLVNSRQYKAQFNYKM